MSGFNPAQNIMSTLWLTWQSIKSLWSRGPRSIFGESHHTSKCLGSQDPLICPHLWCDWLPPNPLIGSSTAGPVLGPAKFPIIWSIGRAWLVPASQGVTWSPPISWVRDAAPSLAEAANTFLAPPSKKISPTFFLVSKSIHEEPEVLLEKKVWSWVP